MYTGKMITAREAERIGFVSKEFSMTPIEENRLLKMINTKATANYSKE
jgi:hypothetical protein